MNLKDFEAGMLAALVEAWKEIKLVERPFLKLYLLIVAAALSIKLLEWLIVRAAHWLI